MAVGLIDPAPKVLMTRGHQVRPTQSGAGPVVIPSDKVYFRIAEVSELTKTKAHVLRYWETEFPTLRPMKNSSGRRIYSREDLDKVFEIKRLLYEEGFTIAGARKLLGSNSGDSEGPSQKSPKSAQPASSPTVGGQHLHAIKRELQGILTILSSKC